MKNFLALLSIFALSASAETILVGKSKSEFTIKKDRIGSLPGIDTKGDHPVRYKGATIGLRQAVFEVNGNNMLVLKNFEVVSLYDGLEGDINDRIKNNAIKIGPIKVDKIDVSIRWTTAKFPDAYLRLAKFPAPVEIISLSDLNKDPEVSSQQIREALKKVLLPENLEVDKIYQTSVERKGDDHVTKTLVDMRSTLAEKLISPAIDVVAKEAVAQSVY